MKISKMPAVLGAMAALAAPVAASAESLELGLFSKPVPIHRIAMADLDLPNTSVNPAKGIGTIFNTPIDELSPYLSVSTSVPLISLDIVNHEASLEEIKATNDIEKLVAEKKSAPSIFSASLTASEQITFPDRQNLGVKGRLELFLNSPMMDKTISDGNRLYLVGGFEKLGSIDLSGAGNKTLSAIAHNLFPNYTNVFADLYIVPHSPYSDQFLIIRAGLGNLLNPDKTDVHLSTTWEFPSIFSFLDSNLFKNFKVSPYVSVYMSALTKNMQSNDNELRADKYLFSAEAGIKAERFVVYAGVKSSTNQPVEFSSGFKADLSYN